MVVAGDITLFPCGKGKRPGQDPGGSGGNAGGGGGVLVGSETDPFGTLEPPFDPQVHPAPPTFECKDILREDCPAGSEPGFGLGSPLSEFILRACIPCLDEAGNPLRSTIMPPPGRPECQYLNDNCDDVGLEPCVNQLCPSGEFQRFKCKEVQSVPCPEGTISNHPAGNQISQIIKECQPCQNPNIEVGCNYFDANCGGECVDGPIYPCFVEDEIGDVQPTGPSVATPTTGPKDKFNCVTEKEFCPPGSPRAGEFYRIKKQECLPCKTEDSGQVGTSITVTQSNPGFFSPPVIGQGGFFKVPPVMIPEVSVFTGPCQFDTKAACDQGGCTFIANVTTTGQQPIELFCMDATNSLGGVNRPEPGDPPGPTPAGPLGIPNRFADIVQPDPEPNRTPFIRIPEQNSVVQNQVQANAKIINPLTVGEGLNEDKRRSSLGKITPNLFDPTFNFFSVEPLNPDVFVSHTFDRKLFAEEIAVEVSRVLEISNTSAAWDEVTLQNLTDDKILRSLSTDLVNAFEFLRFVGGKVVGTSVLASIIRKHLLEGTIDEFDVDFYIQAAEGQISSKFELIEVPKEKERAEELAISYLINNLNTFKNDKPEPRDNFEVNRIRPLNEDMNIRVSVDKLDGTTDFISIPNEGFDISAINPEDSTTRPVIGYADKINIGDGGGYYVSAEGSDGTVKPLYTDSLINDSYFAPAPVRARVLDMLGIESSITITASSLPNKHEFVADDLGASAVTPLFFALDLSSVSGEYSTNSLVENYTANYVLLTASADIERHVNNNAFTTPMLCVDYRDPIYRYILDTSSLTASLNDFNLVGFEDKAFSSIGARFVKNIPFGFVVTPVAGGKFNPLNTRSKLISKDSTHVRALKVAPAIDSSVDARTPPAFRFYNLKLEDDKTRVGIGEEESLQNVGFEYLEEDYIETFFSVSGGGYGLSSSPPSSLGLSFMLKDVIDYLITTYGKTTFTWYDVYSRMPVNRVGELFFENKELLREIANGFREGIRLEDVAKNSDGKSKVIPDDSKTIVKVTDREGVTSVVA